MSNRLCVEYTKFVNLNDSGQEVDHTFGFRIYDDYQAEYRNTYYSFEELRVSINRENIQEFLEREYFDFYEDRRGVELNDEWVEFNGIYPQERGIL